jgi:hypothetical protein
LALGRLFDVFPWPLAKAGMGRAYGADPCVSTPCGLTLLRKA